MLSLVEVSAGYDSLRALFGVSLEVTAGETVGVIGPNGAGKTTLMRVISGLVASFAGAITLDGRSIVGAPAHRIVEHGIAHVPENRRLFPKLSVEDNLRIGAFIPPRAAILPSSLHGSTSFFRSCASDEASPPARFRAASSRCAPSVAR
jgi:branched-chain amino acid transport system ATP-binding protein